MKIATPILGKDAPGLLNESLRALPIMLDNSEGDIGANTPIVERKARDIADHESEIRISISRGTQSGFGKIHAHHVVASRVERCDELTLTTACFDCASPLGQETAERPFQMTEPTGAER